MDDLDRADEYQAHALKAALAVRKEEGPQATGKCLFCEEPIEGRWCSVECRAAWEFERRRG
jgi:hypothetical protein